jgi:hypothetical protein
MDIHFEKIVPIVIAIVLIYLNARKKSKKTVNTAQTSSDEDQPSQANSRQGIMDPFFKGLDGILNIDQPVVQKAKEAEHHIKYSKPKKEPLPAESVNVPVPEVKLASQEPVIDAEHFDFDVKRAIIDAEIMNRKYFTI